MCLRCDGYSEEEVDRAHELAIRVHGWTGIQVSDDGDSGWTYTLGLNDRLGHPDLIMIDVELEVQGQIVDWLASMVAETGSLDVAVVEANGIELVPVHPDQLCGGLVAQWSHTYGRYPAGGEFLQVLPPRGSLCACHSHQVRRLDGPPEGDAPSSF